MGFRDFLFAQPVVLWDRDLVGQRLDAAVGRRRLVAARLDFQQFQRDGGRKHEGCFSSVGFDAAKEGDKLALKAVDKLTFALGKSIAGIAAVTNPQVIVIGGGVSKAGKFLLDKIEEYFNEYAFHATKNVKFALATLGNDAGMYGAAALILD